MNFSVLKYISPGIHVIGSFMYRQKQILLGHSNSPCWSTKWHFMWAVLYTTLHRHWNFTYMATPSMNVNKINTQYLILDCFLLVNSHLIFQGSIWRNSQENLYLKPHQNYSTCTKTKDQTEKVNIRHFKAETSAVRAGAKY